MKVRRFKFKFKLNSQESTNDMKHSFFEMIEDAVLTLGERKGSSRQAIWKYISTKYPEADYKMFITRLRKVKENNNIVSAKKGMKYMLSDSYKKNLIKKLKAGSSTKKATKSKATMKKTQKRKSAKSSGSTSSKKGKKSSTKKTGKKSASGRKGRKAGKASTQKAAGKQTQGSKQTQQKKQVKKTMNNKKAQVSKAKNTRKSSRGSKKSTQKKVQNVKKGATGIASKRRNVKTTKGAVADHDADEAKEEH